MTPIDNVYTKEEVDQLIEAAVAEAKAKSRETEKQAAATIQVAEKEEITGVYRHRPGFVARSRPIRSYGRIQIISKEKSI